MRNTTMTQTIARSGLALAAVPLLLIGLAACSSDGDATEKDPSSMSESDKKAAAHEFDLAVAKCLRDKGVNSPDPDANGGGQAISIDDPSKANDVFAAAKTCNEDVTKQLGKRPVTAAEKRESEKAEKEAKEREACLKSKGYDLSGAVEGAAGGDSDGASITAGPASDIPDDVLKACGAGGDGSSGVSFGPEH